MKSRSFVVVLALAAACASPAKEDAKGQVDDSAPPSTPAQLGKADASSKVVAVDVQSTHPYANDLNRTYTVPLANLPSCAQTARLHFEVLRTEAGYDYVSVPATGESFDGIADDTWTEWFSVTSSSAGRVKLTSDSSITRHGFEIDAIEWDGLPAGCPLVRFPPCGSGTVDLAEVPGTCECPVAPQCHDISTVEVSHHLWRGFNNTKKTAQGTTALYTHPPADGPETDTWGTVDGDQLAALVRRAVELGRLHGPSYSRSISAGGFGEEFTIRAGSLEVTFSAMQGQQDPDVQSLIDEFEALFTCGGGGLSCGAGWECEQGQCIATQSCICPALYDPQCGTNGVTYGNNCEAGCANAPIAHAGECGIPGDPCGTIIGLACQGDNKCRFGPGTFTYPWPDAGGTCVAPDYCDAPPDCAGLPHIAVPGSWACNQNQCAWQTGIAWKTTSFVFETSHPYGNNQSVWYQVYLPSGAQAMRLRQSGFRTEAGYDFLEVWAWKNGAWQKARSYSGNAVSSGPQLSDEFTGQYFYLKFVSDSSVTDTGFTVYPEYR